MVRTRAQRAGDSSPAVAVAARRAGQRRLKAGAQSVADLEAGGIINDDDDTSNKDNNPRTSRKRGPAVVVEALPGLEAVANKRQRTRRGGPATWRTRVPKEVYDVPVTDTEEEDDAGENFMSKVNAATKEAGQARQEGEREEGRQGANEGEEEDSIVVQEPEPEPAAKSRGRPKGGKKGRTKVQEPKPPTTKPATARNQRAVQQEAQAEQQQQQQQPADDSGSGDGSYATADEGTDADDQDPMPAPSETGTLWEVAMQTRPVALLASHMRKLAWAGKTDWEDDFIVKGDSPVKPRTREAGALSDRLYDLADMYFAVPHPFGLGPRDEYDFSLQFDELQARHGELRDIYKGVARNTRQICDRLKIDGQEAEPEDVEEDSRAALVDDLRHLLIPQVILVLKTACMLGGAYEDGDGAHRCVEEGTFTPASLDVVGRVLGWLGRLGAALVVEMRHGPTGKPYRDAQTVAPNSGSASSKKAGEEEQQQQRRSEAKRFAARARQLAHITYLEELVSGAERALEEARREVRRREAGEARRRAMLEREEEVRAARRRAAEEEAERAEREWRAVCASTQALRAAPDPLEEHYARTMGGAYRVGPLSSAAAAAGVEGPQGGERQSGKSPGLTSEFSAEESEYLLNLLRRSGSRQVDWRRVAARLERPVGEVIWQADALKRAMRSLVQETRVGRPPKWAKAS